MSEGHWGKGIAAANWKAEEMDDKLKWPVGRRGGGVVLNIKALPFSTVLL